MIDAAEHSTTDECPSPYLYPSCHPPSRGESNAVTRDNVPAALIAFAEIRPHLGNAWALPLAVEVAAIGKSISPAGFRLRRGAGPPDALVRKKLVLGGAEMRGMEA